MEIYHNVQAEKKMRAEGFEAIQNAHLVTRRMQIAQNLEHDIQIAKVQLALHQLQQERNHTLGQLLEDSLPPFDTSVMLNNDMKLQARNTNESSLLAHIFDPLPSLRVPSLESPVWDIQTASSNLGTLEQSQDIASIPNTHPSEVLSSSAINTKSLQLDNDSAVSAIEDENKLNSCNNHNDSIPKP